MESKLGLNFDLVNQARASAAKIADDTQRFIDQHTTVTVERAVCRLLELEKPISELTSEDLHYIGAYASTAASLSTEMPGGIPSIPEKDAVLKAM